MDEARAVPVRALRWDDAARPELAQLLEREWLVTNGLGGYASGTVPGVNTRRHHGLLIAALPAPLGRMTTLKHLAEQARLPDGTAVQLSGEEPEPGRFTVPTPHHLSAFRLENGLPVWRYCVGEAVVEKRILMPHLQNTVHLTYRLLVSPAPLRLLLRPAVNFRPYDGRASETAGGPYRLSVEDGRYQISAKPGAPPLRLLPFGERTAFTVEAGSGREIFLRVEDQRGYDARGVLWSPGHFDIELLPGEEATLMASTEPWHTALALDPAEAREYEQARRARLVRQAHPALREGPPAELVLAADQFLISPCGRVRDFTRAAAAGDQVRGVIAGYHWFTDWGRDTMISLEGLTLATGRHVEAGWILRTFVHHLRDGLLPNMFPEGKNEGCYNSADATLWLFHALDRYVQATGDRDTLRAVLPRLLEVVDCHLQGTRFGIGVDPADGLLRQGAEGYALTWMDAKLEDWVVTPRRGKAVEINALWYNALCLLADWVGQERDAETAHVLHEHARRARAAFNRRFWYEAGRYLYDVVDGEEGDDAACRPNQIFAFSLRHPVLERACWAPVLEVVRQRLLTPVGLRSLAPGHPDYQERYFGDLRARDAAYHQGTVWGWLLGPYIDAWLAVHPNDRAGARHALDGIWAHLDAGCVGSISEVFDAQAPFTERGCIAQAWSVAEVLRAWVKTAAPADATNRS